MHTITISNLLTQLGNISTTQPWEQNEKQVLTVFLQTVAKSTAPNSGQLATLQTIGEQCPRIGGPAAVYFAAMLYQGFTGDVLVQDNCETSERNVVAGKTTTSVGQGNLVVMAYPNPVSSQLVLNIANGLPPYSVQIMDMLGRVTLRQENIIEQSNLRVQHFAEGVYQLQVTDAKGQRNIQSVFVKH